MVSDSICLVSFKSKLWQRIFNLRLFIEFLNKFIDIMLKSQQNSPLSTHLHTNKYHAKVSGCKSLTRGIDIVYISQKYTLTTSMSPCTYIYSLSQSHITLVKYRFRKTYVLYLSSERFRLYGHEPVSSNHHRPGPAVFPAPNQDQIRAVCTQPALLPQEVPARARV